MSITHETFAIERHYDHTPAQTFSAFADPSLKGQWFGAPGDWSDRTWELDFRVGGGETSGGTAPDGVHHLFESRIHQIVQDERIVFAYDLLIDRRLISISLTTVELFPDGPGTRLLFTEQGAFFGPPGDAAGRAHGTGLLLDALGGFLAGEPVR